MSEKNTYLKKINDAHLLCGIVSAAQAGIREAVEEEAFTVVVKLAGIWSRATENIELIDANAELIADLGDEWYGWHTTVEGNLHLIIADTQRIVIEDCISGEKVEDDPLNIIIQSAYWAIGILNDIEDEEECSERGNEFDDML